LLDLYRGESFDREPVRFHILRHIKTSTAVGFFIDFGWDAPNDSTREIDLAFPKPADRGLASYLDATVIVAQYLFRNRLAKRIRWRVDAPKGKEPRRSLRQGARLLLKQQEKHPITGAWTTKYVYEYALADFEALGRKVGIDPYTDYADIQESLFAAYRRDP